MGLYYNNDDSLHSFCLQHEYSGLDNKEFVWPGDKNFRQFVYFKFLYGEKKHWIKRLVLGEGIFVLLLEAQSERVIIKGFEFDRVVALVVIEDFIEASKSNSF